MPAPLPMNYGAKVSTSPLKTDLKSSQLEQAFKAFFINKGGDPNARLFVWFAGHGHTENGEGFLIPADAPRPEVGRKFKFAALPMRRFGEYVRLAESKHAFAVFDSCFSGTVFEGARALPPTAVKLEPPHYPCASF